MLKFEIGAQASDLKITNNGVDITSDLCVKSLRLEKLSIDAPITTVHMEVYAEGITIDDPKVVIEGP